MEAFSVYKDMQSRTNGEIYIGVVGQCDGQIDLHQEIYGYDGHPEHRR